MSSDQFSVVHSRSANSFPPPLSGLLNYYLQHHTEFTHLESLAEAVVTDRSSECDHVHFCQLILFRSIRVLVGDCREIYLYDTFSRLPSPSQTNLTVSLLAPISDSADALHLILNVLTPDWCLPASWSRYIISSQVRPDRRTRRQLGTTSPAM